MAGDDALEFLLDLAVETKAAEKVLGELDGALKSVNVRFDTFTRVSMAAAVSHKKHAAEARGLKGVLQDLKGGAMDELLGGSKSLAEFAGKSIVKGAGKLIDLGREAIHAAAEQQRVSGVLASLSGGKEAGAANEEWLARFARASETSEKRAQQTFIALKKAGLDDVSARLALKASADIAAVSDNKDEAMDAAIGAFAQANKKGKIDASALAPLGLGAQKGDVTRDELIDLIMKKTNETKLGERSADNADLLITKMEKLTELPERFFARLSKTDAIQTLSGALGRLLAMLDPDSPMGKKISGVLEVLFSAGAEAVDALIAAIDQIDFSAMSDVIRNDVVPAVKEVITWIGPIIEGVERVIRGFHRMKDLIFGKVDDSALKDFNTNPNFKRTLGDNADDDNPSWLQAGDKKGRALGEGVRTGARDALDIHSPSKVFADLGRMSAAGFAEGIDNEAGSVDDAVEQMFPTPATARGGQSGGGPAINIELHVHVGAGASEGDHATARELAAQVAEVLPSALEDALEKVGIGMGSS